VTKIILETPINAPIKDVFNLSLDIDFHIKSASQTSEQAIAGTTSGQIAYGETVTWRGKHFGLWLTHTSIISEYTPSSFFVDEMIDGNFKSFRHEHRFQTVTSGLNDINSSTIMQDILTYEVPYGILGRLFDFLFLRKHMLKFLKTRNLKLKKVLEV